MFQNPDINLLIQWFTEGGKLDSSIAAMAIGLLVRYVLLPIVKSMMTARGKPMTQAAKVIAAYACGIVATVIWGLITRDVTLSVAIALGITAGAIAIGLHQTGKVTATPTAVALPTHGEVLSTLQPIRVAGEEQKEQLGDSANSAPLRE